MAAMAPYRRSRRSDSESFQREMEGAWRRARSDLAHLGYWPMSELRYDRRQGEVVLRTNAAMLEGLTRRALWASRHPEFQREEQEEARKRFPLVPDPDYDPNE
jgi:hypothetical protein